MQCKSLFLWSEDDIATSLNEMTPIEVNLTIAVITEYHMSGWSEDGLPLPPIWISQSPLHLWSKIWVRFVACDSVRFGIDKVKLDPPLKVLNLPT